MVCACLELQKNEPMLQSCEAIASQTQPDLRSLGNMRQSNHFIRKILAKRTMKQNSNKQSSFACMPHKVFAVFYL